MSRPSVKNAVTARICTLYGGFSGRSDSRFLFFSDGGLRGRFSGSLQAVLMGCGNSATAFRNIPAEAWRGMRRSVFWVGVAKLLGSGSVWVV